MCTSSSRPPSLAGVECVLGNQGRETTPLIARTACSIKGSSVNSKYTHQNSIAFLSAFEFQDETSMELVTTYLGLHNPIRKWPFYVLVETSGSNDNHDEEVCL